MRNKICTVTTIMAPLNQTISFVNYHLNIGIDHVFLFFDNPNDEAVDVLKDYERVTCFRCDDEYWRSQGVKGKIPIETKQRINSRKVLKEVYDWVAHIDCDELIYLKEPLKKFLRKIPEGIDYVRLPTLEALPEKIYYEDRLREVSLFKENFGNISKRYFMGNISGKSITRNSDRIENLGIHTPELKKGCVPRYKFSLRGRILHFDCCGFEDWKAKWGQRSRKRTVAVEMGGIRKKILSEFEEVSKKGDEEGLIELYKRQFFMSGGGKRIFEMVGFLRRVKLEEKLFLGAKD